MNYKQTIEKKLYKNQISKYMMILLAVVTVLSLAFAFLTIGKETASTKAVFFDPVNCKEDEYSYIPVVSFDDEYVAERGSEKWYSGYDAENYCYILKVSSSTVKKLDKQVAYYNDESTSAEEYTLYGRTVKTPTELISIYADVYGITEGEVKDYFGDYYLDCTASAVSNNSSAYLFLLAALFAGLFALVFACVYFPTKKALNKCLDALSQNWALETCAEEIETMDGDILLGNDYLYCKKNPFVIKYSDVKWVYTQVQRVNFIPVSKTLVLATLNCGNLIVNMKNKNGLYDEIVKRIGQNNPELLAGYSRENNAAFRTMVKEAKGK